MPSKINTAKLRAARLADCLTQEQVAEAINVAPHVIQRLEGGQKTTCKTFFAVCDLLQLNPVECLV